MTVLYDDQFYYDSDTCDSVLIFFGDSFDF